MHKIKENNLNYTDQIIQNDLILTFKRVFYTKFILAVLC